MKVYNDTYHRDIHCGNAIQIIMHLKLDSVHKKVWYNQNHFYFPHSQILKLQISDEGTNTTFILPS